MTKIQRVIRLILDGDDPNPTMVIDTRWNLADANAAALWLSAGVVLQPPVSVARLSLHPDGLATRVTNVAEYAGHLLRRMRRTVSATQDPDLAALLRAAPHGVGDSLAGNRVTNRWAPRWRHARTVHRPDHRRARRPGLDRRRAGLRPDR